MRVLIAFAAIAIVACYAAAPETTFVETSNPEVEPIVDHAKDEVAADVTSTAGATNQEGNVKNTESQVEHTEDSSETGQETACPIGEILCPDTNTCRANCHTESPRSDENDSGTLSTNFEVNIHTIPAVEKPQGTAAQYNAEAEHLASEKSAIANSITGASEAITATSAVAGENSHAAQQKALELMKTDVEMKMQVAAKNAALFAKANDVHKQKVSDLKAARAKVKFQESIVDKAKKALENEKKKLKDLQAKADDARAVEESAKISAEQDGDHYVAAKTAAITADKALNEETLKIKRSEEIQKAVQDTTQKELQHFAEEDAAKAAAEQAHQAGTDATPAAKKTPETPPKVEEAPKEEHKKEGAKPVCKNCDTLAEAEQQQNPQASCADCDGWAAEGQCTQIAYKEFMHANCAKSCGVGACSASDIPAAAKPQTAAIVHPATGDHPATEAKPEAKKP